MISYKIIIFCKLFSILCFTYALVKIASSYYVSEKLGFTFSVFLMFIIATLGIVYMVESAIEIKNLILDLKS